MPNFFQRLPNAFAICASTLLCAVVVLLQNAASYADRLEESVAVLAADTSRLLQQISGVTGARSLNNVEKGALKTLELWETEADAAEEGSSTAEEPPVEPASPARQEPPREVAQAQPPAPERVLMPAVESRWWPALSSCLATEDSIERRFSASAPGGVLLRRRGGTAAPRVHVAVLPPAPAEPEEDTAEPVEDEPDTPEPVQLVAAQPVAEPEPPAQPAEARPLQAPPMRYRIMMVGDSLMEDLGPLTHRRFKDRKGVEFVICARFSTGLCRPQVFNWPVHLKEQVAKRPPDLVVFFMGANDGMPIREGKRSVPLGGDPWREAYMRKMDELVSIAREAGAEVIWVELPAVGGRYNSVLHENQRAQREYCERNSILTLRTDDLFSGEWGKFEAFGEYKGAQVRLRRKDLVHLTPDGNAKLFDHLNPILENCMVDFYLAHPERRLSEDELSRIKNVPVVYTCKYTPPPKKPQPEPQPAQPAPASQPVFFQQ